MKTIRVVAALIEDPRDESRFLVQQRLPNKSRANLWEFPGGKVEPGETDEQALARECVEELDVELAVGRRLWSTSHDYDDLTVQLELFAATIVKGEPKALGAQALKFCTPVEMQALPFCEADLPLLEELVSGAVPTR
ncbi:MAG: (deoxy)nucleoside triphosphate pyrophosphohydrolase [Archangium gephyra]|uniref:8-oxo-dGTP diphosphatase n=1 Tax=Archangium gephyra TaxID=48 RepID=A0A2W5TBK1_9BACT|nr:MAG: (deoxy)nucleoside triphosphate pyrophosphohydrolase [Archangium gephyra]